MKSRANQVRRYFATVPKQWDALYSHESRLRYAVNRWLRSGLFRRYELTFERCGDLTGASVLDVGCGTGRYSIECAKRGARRVVGIDFAPSMIEFSRSVARDVQVADVCEFLCDDFLAHPFDRTFDVVLALGLFDYICRPEPVLRKIASLAPRTFVASFPRFTPLWGLQRHVRYHWIRRCPIFNYTKRQLERLYQQAAFDSVDIIKGSTGYVVAAGMNRETRPQEDGQHAQPGNTAGLPQESSPKAIVRNPGPAGATLASSGR